MIGISLCPVFENYNWKHTHKVAVGLLWEKKHMERQVVLLSVLSPKIVV